MSLNVTFNGSMYIIPETGEVGWGGNTTSYLVAIAAGALQKTGGSFTLSAETDFGASFGLKSLYYRSRSTTVSSAGILRLANNSDAVSWRNAANSGDLALIVDASNDLLYNGNKVLTGTGPSSYVSSITGTSNQVNASASTGAVTLSLPQSINTSAAVQFGTLGLGSAIETSAALSMSSTTLGLLMPRMTTTQRDAIVSPATGLEIFNTSTGVFNYYNGSSWVAIAAGGTINAGTQYQLAYYAANGTTLSGLTLITGSRALQSDSNGLPVASAVTSTELGYLSGVTSAIQTQINSKLNSASPVFTGTLTGPSATFTATTNQLTLGTTNTTTISATAPAASATYTIPDVGTTANFILSAGTQTIGGSKTFSSAVTITPTTNQIVLGTTNTYTINATAPSTSRTITLADPGANASFVLTEGAQTINGTKTFTGTMTLDSGSSAYFMLDRNANTNEAIYKILTNGTENAGFGADNDSTNDVHIFVNGDFGTPRFTFKASTDGDTRIKSTGTVEGRLLASASTAFFVQTQSNHPLRMTTNNSGTVALEITTSQAVNVHGTATNDSASAGYVGEYISSSVSNVSAPASNTTGNVTSISLTAGDWDVSGVVQLNRNSATYTMTTFEIAVTTTSGGSGTVGDSDITTGIADLTWSFLSASIPTVRFSLSATTTVYLTIFPGAYSAGTPKYYGRISARRVR